MRILGLIFLHEFWGRSSLGCITRRPTGHILTPDLPEIKCHDENRTQTCKTKNTAHNPRPELVNSGYTNFGNYPEIAE